MLQVKEIHWAPRQLCYHCFWLPWTALIVSTVLPRISEHLGNPSLYPWVMSAFLLPVALVAPLAGACADRLGSARR
ncbi:hypothetical protein P4S72_16320 [Vibrio sp. PP-XX7]